MRLPGSSPFFRLCGERSDRVTVCGCELKRSSSHCDQLLVVLGNASLITDCHRLSNQTRFSSFIGICYEKRFFFDMTLKLEADWIVFKYNWI